MDNPQNLTLWQAICKDPGALVSSAALILNVIITSFHYIWVRRQTSSERRYNLDFTFYKLLVVDLSKELILFSSETKRLLQSLIKQCRQGVSRGHDVRRIVEQHIEDLEKINESIGLSKLPLVKGYSTDLGLTIETLMEDFYDQSTNIFSKFNRLAVSPEFERKMGNCFAHLETQYIKNLFDSIKRYCPSA